MSGTVVIGAAGGCGATTVACALALIQGGEGVTPLLVDGDLHGGGPGALWGLDSARGLDDLEALGAEVQAAHVEHLVHRHACGVDVMAGGATVSSSVLHDPLACSAIAEYAASRPNWVADCGRGDSGLAHALVPRADRVVMVVPCTLQGAGRAAMLGGRFDAHGPVALAARWVAGERVPARVLARSLGLPEVVGMGRDDRAARDVASARAPRGRGLVRTLEALVHP